VKVGTPLPKNLEPAAAPQAAAPEHGVFSALLLLQPHRAPRGTCGRFQGADGATVCPGVAAARHSPSLPLAPGSGSTASHASTRSRDRTPINSQCNCPSTCRWLIDNEIMFWDTTARRSTRLAQGFRQPQGRMMGWSHACSPLLQVLCKGARSGAVLQPAIRHCKS